MKWGYANSLKFYGLIKERSLYDSTYGNTPSPKIWFFFTNLLKKFFFTLFLTKEEGKRWRSKKEREKGRVGNRERKREKE